MLSHQKFSFCISIVIALGSANGQLANALPATWYVAPTGSCSTNSTTCGTTYENNQACCRIQDAMNRSSNGDTVLVKPGTYSDQLIRFLGKGITVKKDINYPGDALVERHSNFAAVVEFNCASGCGADHGTLGGISENGVWEGFTITAKGNGIKVISANPIIKGNVITGCQDSGILLSDSATTFEKNIICQNTAQDGGGIRAYGASNNITITECVIEGNTAFGPPLNQGGGGGVRLTGAGSVTISRCIIRDNQAARYGGGIFTKDVSASVSSVVTLLVTIKDSLIINNSTIVQATGDGGGITFGDSTDVAVINTTFSNNYARDKGGAISFFGDGSETRSIHNSILWNDRSGLQNNPSEIYVHSGTAPTVSYSDIKGGYNGTGIINSDPLFCDAASNDYRLMANPNASPCIDTGDTSVASTLDLDGNDRVVDGPDGDTTDEVDMGCYEYQGSGSGCTAGGLELACSTGLCKAASIDVAIPADGTIDARRPHPGGTTAVAMSSRTGIGSPNSYTGGPEPITITLRDANNALVTGATALTCWELCETDIEVVDTVTPALGPNRIVSVQENGTGVYEILLERPISGKEWSTVSYLGGSDAVSYASLPGDADLNGTTNGLDILYLVDCCLNCICGGGCLTNPYQCDIDHSGVIAGPDNNAQVDLFNGTGNFIVWSGKSLPTNDCSSSSMSEFAAGVESDDVDDHATFADWFVSYLASANPANSEEEAEFGTIAAGFVEFIRQQFTVLERDLLIAALSDTELKFASPIGKVKAGDVVSELRQ